MFGDMIVVVRGKDNDFVLRTFVGETGPAPVVSGVRLLDWLKYLF
jgi:hypothetical protein